MIPKNIITRS